MSSNLKRKFFRRLHVKESWVIFFVLGIIMMNYPFIHIFYKPDTLVFGMPVLYLYLYLGWLVSIIIIYLFVKAINLQEDENTGEHH